MTVPVNWNSVSNRILFQTALTCIGAQKGSVPVMSRTTGGDMLCGEVEKDELQGELALRAKAGALGDGPAKEAVWKGGVDSAAGRFENGAGRDVTDGDPCGSEDQHQ